jgi:hypothetical protein
MVTVDDIIDRLYRRKPFWFHGKPDIRVEGNRGKFGKLIFDFHDEIVVYKIYSEIEPSRLMWIAEMAIKLFPESAKELYDQGV